ncbi:MAG: hypothetical protein NUW21_10005, partial [Elusimicrobia bacterium]|nr:hypothetical protein [Elusimicrobiota bacterium]
PPAGARPLNTPAARERVLAAYSALRALLEATGVLSGRAPAGGAESDAPLPGPVLLPLPAEVGEWL